MFKLTKFLKHLRIDYGLRQKDFSKIMGYNPQYYCGLEKGKRIPPKNFSIKLLKKFPEYKEKEDELKKCIKEVIFYHKINNTVLRLNDKEKEIFYLKLSELLNKYQQDAFKSEEYALHYDCIEKEMRKP